MQQEGVKALRVNIRTARCAKTRREKNTQQKIDNAHTHTQSTQLTLLEHRLQTIAPLTGQDGPGAHCPMYSGEWAFCPDLCSAALPVPRRTQGEFLHEGLEKLGLVGAVNLGLVHLGRQQRLGALPGPHRGGWREELHL